MGTRSPRLSKNQQGFASLIIALVMILVLSLITVGFAQLMRREQRSALDKQLNSQAYYAAESGINDATAAINEGYTIAKQSCSPLTATDINNISISDPTLKLKAQTAAQKYLTNNAIGTGTGANYPCLLINPTPNSLQYGSIATTDSKVTEMAGVDSSGNSAVIKTIEVSWEAVANGSNQFAPNCNTFSPATAGSGQTWSNASGPYISPLRLELIPINDMSRDGLINGSYTAYLCPDTSASNSSNYVSNTGTGSGVIVDGRCTNNPPTDIAPRRCNAQIKGLASLNQTTFFLVMRSIYYPTAVTVTAYSSDGVNQANILSIAGAQTLVDSTGKAQDVLRRIQARVPVHNNYNIPNGTSAMTSLCKQLQLTPSNGASGGGPNCAIP